MSRIGFLIPEFPGQTHAFFVRERRELKKMGMDTQLISTRKPLAGIASHDWAKDAANETTYLFPIFIKDLLTTFVTALAAGPVSWFQSAQLICVAPETIG